MLLFCGFYMLMQRCSFLPLHFTSRESPVSFKINKSESAMNQTLWANSSGVQYQQFSKCSEKDLEDFSICRPEYHQKIQKIWEISVHKGQGWDPAETVLDPRSLRHRCIERRQGSVTYIRALELSGKQLSVNIVGVKALPREASTTTRMPLTSLVLSSWDWPRRCGKASFGLTSPNFGLFLAIIKRRRTIQIVAGSHFKSQISDGMGGD